MAIIGDLSITTSDGKVLSASNDLTLAWLWAAHEVNAQMDGAWDTMGPSARHPYVAEALTELRRAYGESEY